MTDPIESYLDATARFLCGPHLFEKDEEIDLEYEEVLDQMTTIGATMRAGRITSYPKEGIEGIDHDVFNRTDADQLAKITGTFYEVWNNFRPGGRTQEAVDNYGQLRFEIEELRSRRGDLTDWADEVVDAAEGADPEDDRVEKVANLVNWMAGFKQLIDNIDDFGLAVANRGLLRGDEEPEGGTDDEGPAEGEEVEESRATRTVRMRGRRLMESSGMTKDDIQYMYSQRATELENVYGADEGWSTSDWSRQMQDRALEILFDFLEGHQKERFVMVYHPPSMGRHSRLELKVWRDDGEMLDVTLGSRGGIVEDHGGGSGGKEVEETVGRRIGSVLLEASGPEVKPITGTDSAKVVFPDGDEYVYDIPLTHAPRSRDSLSKVKNWVDGWDKRKFEDHEDWSVWEGESDFDPDFSDVPDFTEARGPGADRVEVIAWMRNQVLKLDKSDQTRRILKDRDVFERYIAETLSEHQTHIWADGADHPIVRYIDDHDWSRLIADAHKSLARRVKGAADRGLDWDDLGFDASDL